MRGSTRRLRLPGKRAKAATQIVAQRFSDVPETPDERRCLICPRRTSRGFAKGPEVRTFEIGSFRLHSNGLRVRLISPYDYPVLRGRREVIRKAPFGADVELLQSGRRIARLRIVARCFTGGQSSRCRFRKISTKR